MSVLISDFLECVEGLEVLVSAVEIDLASSVQSQFLCVCEAASRIS